MKTKKLYDIDAYKTEFDARVLSCEKGEDDRYCVVLDQTLFFPEEGGQTPDKGTLDEIEVLDVQIKGDVVFHYTEEAFEVDSIVRGTIDWSHRFSNMQQHSAEHIFSGLAYKKYGYANVGFHLSNQIVTMDFSGVFTEEELREMEWEVNEAIAKNVEIKTGYPSKEELANLEYRSKIEIEGDIRIVEVVGYDMCACCAPHVKHTGEIGGFKIQSAQKYKGGMRISFLAGFRALEEYRVKAAIISELSDILSTNQMNLPEYVNKLKSQIYDLKGQLSTAKQTLLESKIAEIPVEQKDVILFEKDLDAPVMRTVINKLMDNHEGICGIFVGDDANGYQYILGSKVVNCSEVSTKLREELGARGGGKPQMVQGSVEATEEHIKRVLL